MTISQLQSLPQAFDAGWLAVLGFLGLWGWRALVGAHKLGRLEQKLCDMQASFDRHRASDAVWKRDTTARLDKLIERK